jgi:hypothetical protein
VWCILDTLSNIEGGLPTDVSINSIDFIIYILTKKGYNIFIGDSETELLTAASTDYSHAVIISIGTHLGTNIKLFSEVDKLCKTDFFVAGHILDRGADYLELHQQFYIINLAIYKELDCPEIWAGSWLLEDMHEATQPVITYRPDSNYVIESIVQGNIKKLYYKKRHGYNILQLALDHNKVIIDIGNSIRSSKYFLYPDVQHVFYKELSKIFQMQLISKNVVAQWNTDIMHKQITFDGPVDQYITVGTGLYWINNLELLGVTEQTRVIFTDINYNCLCFMKDLVSNWDGINYDSFFKQYQQILPNGVSENVFKNISTEKEFEEFKLSFSDWTSTWNKIKKLKFEFILIDYVADYDLSFIKPNHRTVINLSDLFNHHTQIPFQSVKFRIGAENKLLDKLNSIDPEITVISFTRPASSFMQFNNICMTDTGVFIDKVKNFKYTDINLLKKLPWHHSDWNHVGQRPFGL